MAYISYNPASSADEWVDSGIFLRNTRTGELRLKNLEGGLLGIERELPSARVSEAGYPLYSYKDLEIDPLANEIDTFRSLGVADGWRDDGLMKQGATAAARYGGEALGRFASTGMGLTSSVLEMVGADETARGIDEWQDEFDENLNKLVYTGDSGGSSSQEFMLDIGEGRYGEAAAGLGGIILGGTVDFLATRALGKALNFGKAAFAGKKIVDASKVSNNIISGIYAARTFGDTHDQLSDGGMNPYAALFPAAASAAATFYLEKKGNRFNEWLNDGKRISLNEYANGVVAEGLTEALQSGTERFFIEAPLAESLSDLRFTDYLKDMAFGGVVGMGVAGVLGAPQAMRISNKEGFLNIEEDSVSIEDLPDKTKAKLMRDMQYLKVHTEGSAPYGIIGDAQIDMIKTVQSGWKHVREVNDLLRKAISAKEDQVARANESLATAQSLEEAGVQFTETDSDPIRDLFVRVSEFENAILADDKKEIIPSLARFTASVRSTLDRTGVLDSEALRVIRDNVLGGLERNNYDAYGLLSHAQRQALSLLMHRAENSIPQDSPIRGTLTAKIAAAEKYYSDTAESNREKVAGALAATKTADLKTADAETIMRGTVAALSAIVEINGSRIVDKENAEYLKAAASSMVARIMNMTPSEQVASTEADNLRQAISAISKFIGAEYASRPIHNSSEVARFKKTLAVTEKSIREKATNQLDLLKAIHDEMRFPENYPEINVRGLFTQEDVRLMLANPDLTAEALKAIPALLPSEAETFNKLYQMHMSGMKRSDSPDIAKAYAELESIDWAGAEQALRSIIDSKIKAARDSAIESFVNQRTSLTQDMFFMKSLKPQEIADKEAGAEKEFYTMAEVTEKLWSQFRELSSDVTPARFKELISSGELSVGEEVFAQAARDSLEVQEQIRASWNSMFNGSITNARTLWNKIREAARTSPLGQSGDDFFKVEKYAEAFGLLSSAMADAVKLGAADHRDSILRYLERMQLLPRKRASSNGFSSKEFKNASYSLSRPYYSAAATHLTSKYTGQAATAELDKIDRHVNTSIDLIVQKLFPMATRGNNQAWMLETAKGDSVEINEFEAGMWREAGIVEDPAMDSLRTSAVLRIGKNRRAALKDLVAKRGYKATDAEVIATRRFTAQELKDEMMTEMMSRNNLSVPDQSNIDAATSLMSWYVASIGNHQLSPEEIAGYAEQARSMNLSLPTPDEVVQTAEGYWMEDLRRPAGQAAMSVRLGNNVTLSDSDIDELAHYIRASFGILGDSGTAFSRSNGKALVTRIAAYFYQSKPGDVGLEIVNQLKQEAEDPSPEAHGIQSIDKHAMMADALRAGIVTERMIEWVSNARGNPDEFKARQNRLMKFFGLMDRMPGFLTGKKYNKRRTARKWMEYKEALQEVRDQNRSAEPAEQRLVHKERELSTTEAVFGEDGTVPVLTAKAQSIGKYPHELLDEYNASFDADADVALEFYFLTTEAGYKWGFKEEQVKALLNKDRGMILRVKRQLDSFSDAFNTQVTPSTIAMAMTASGHSPAEIKSTLYLIDSLANTYAKETGKSPMTMYHRAALAIFGNLQKDPKQTGVFMTVYNQAIDKDSRIGRVLAKSGGLIGLFGDAATGKRITDSTTMIHEFVHGLHVSGVLGKILGKKEKVILNDYINARLKELKINGEFNIDDPESSRAGSEYLAVLVTTIAQTTAAVDSKVDKSLAGLRGELERNLLNAVRGENSVPTNIDGFPLVASNIDPSVRDAILGVIGLSGAKTRPILSITSDNILFSVTGEIAGKLKATTGLPWDIISKIVFRSGSDASPVEYFESASTTEAQVVAGTAHILKQINPVDIKDEKQLLSIANYAVSDPEAKEHIVSWWKMIRDSKDSEDIKRAKFEKLRKLESINTNDGSSRYTAGVWEQKTNAPSNNKAEDIDSAIAGVIAEVSSTAPPLAGQDMSSVWSEFDKILKGSAKQPLVYDLDPKTPPSLVARALAYRSVQAMSDKWDQIFDSPRVRLEKFFLERGMTRSFLMSQNLGGIFEQAKQLIHGAVMVYDGGKWRVVNESMDQILSEIPYMMREDVWTYLAAKRVLSIQRNNEKKKTEFEMAAAEAEEKGTDFPRRPGIQEIEPRSYAAAVIAANTLELKYGKDGGIVGEYAKRLVKWSNAVVLDKLKANGYLTDDQYNDLKDAGDWYAPLIKAQELTAEGTPEKYFQDGTKIAIKNLQVASLSGIEHPQTEMIKKAMSIHVGMANQSLRNALLAELAYGENGKLLSAEELAQIGLQRATLGPKHFKLEEIDPKDYYAEMRQRFPDETEKEIWDRARNKAEAEWNKLPLHERDHRFSKKDRSKVYYYKRVYDAPVTRKEFHEWYTSLPQNTKERVVSRWIDGEAHYFLMADGDLKLALDSLHPKDLLYNMNVGIRLLRNLSYAAGKLITHSLRFLAAAPLRDIPLGAARSIVRRGDKRTVVERIADSYEPLADYARSLLQVAPSLFPTLAREFPEVFDTWNQRSLGLSMQGGWAGSLEQGWTYEVSPTRQVYTPTDGSGSSLSRVARAVKHDLSTAYHHRKKSLESLMSSSLESTNASYLARLEKYLAKTRVRVQSSVAPAWVTISGLSSGLDAITRVRERELAKRLGTGYSDLYMDWLDRTATIDFERKSHGIRNFNSLYLFAGPMFQDITHMKNSLVDPLKRKSFVFKAIAGMTLPAIANWLRWRDDEEWQNLPYWDKFNHIHLAKNPDGTFKRMVWGIGIAANVFKDLPIAILQVANNKDPEALAEWVRMLQTQTPLQFLPIGQDVRDAAVALTPTAGKPLAQIVANYDQFSGNPVDYNAFSADRGGVPGERDLEQHGYFDVGLAKAANTILPEAAEISPRQASFWATRQFPGLGADVYNIGNALVTKKIVNQLVEDPEIGVDLNRRKNYLPFTTVPAYGARSLPVNRIYQHYQKAARLKSTFDNALKNNHVRKADALLDASPELRYYELLKNASSQINQLKKDRSEFIKYQLRSGVDEEEAYALALEYFDKPMTILAGDILEIYYVSTKQ